MSTAPVVTSVEPSVESPSETDGLTSAELTAHVLAGAGDRVRAAVERLTRMGVLDEHGKVLSQELPIDMRPDSQTTVVTG